MSQTPPKLVLVRHFPTHWNRLRLFQGQRDIPLNEESVEELRSWQCPPEFSGFRLFSSPLSRAVQTAQALFGREPEQENRLTELCYGAFEGRPIGIEEQEIRHAAGIPGWRGLEAKAPGGESLREAILRLQPWLRERAQNGGDSVAVTHKGVLLALFALATGWDGLTKPSPRLRDRSLHVFRLGPDGLPSLEQANVPLASRA